MPFVSFSCLIALAGISSTTLNKSDGSGYSYPVPDLRGKTELFIAECVSCGLVIYGFYYVEICSFYTLFVQSFYHEWMLIFIKSFPTSVDDHMVFILHFNNVMCHVVDLYLLNHPCIPEIKHI